MLKKHNNMMYGGMISATCGTLFLPLYAPLGLVTLGVGITAVSCHLMQWSKFNLFFERAGLCADEHYPKFKGMTKTPTSEIYHFSLPVGMSTEDFEKKQLALEQYLNHKVKINYDYHELMIEEMLSDKQPIYDYKPIQYKGAVSFALGYDDHKQLVACDLSDGSDSAHMLIAGTTGGGKSVCVKSIVTSLILAQKCHLYLIDLKGCELPMFQDCNTVQGFCSDPKTAEDMLSYILGEMQRRYNRLQTTRKKDITTYNASYADKMQHIVVVIDEFAELGSTRNQATVERISALGRGAGIHLIIATQRPDKDVLSPRIKANCNVVLGLKAATTYNSRVIFENDVLTELKGNGHGILRYKGIDTELQTMFIKDSQIRRLIKPFMIDKSCKKDYNELTIDAAPVNIDSILR